MKTFYELRFTYCCYRDHFTRVNDVTKFSAAAEAIKHAKRINKFAEMRRNIDLYHRDDTDKHNKFHRIVSRYLEDNLSIHEDAWVETGANVVEVCEKVIF